MKKSATAIISGVIGAVVGIIGVGYLKQKQAQQKDKKIDKFKSYYNMLNQWLVLKQDDKSLEQYFIENNYKTIAIYGMGEMGNRLYEELKNSSVIIKYAIDSNASSTYSEIEVISPDDNFEEVDAIVVAATFAFDEIEDVLKQKLDCSVVSLEDVVYES